MDQNIRIRALGPGTLSCVVICVLILGLTTAARSDDCPHCRRTALFGNCSINDPDHVVTTKAGPPDPSAGCRSIRNMIAEQMTTDCFHLDARDVVEKYDDQYQDEPGSRYKPPEYTFEAEFVSGLKEQYRQDDNRPIVSRLSVKLYFNGEQKEFVDEWQTEGTLDVQSGGATSWYGHENKFKSAVRDGRQIDDITQDFEKRPDKCTVKPDKDEASPGESIDIEMTDFKDVTGDQSREFNRVVVQVLHGKILGGVPSVYNSDYRVFQVGDGTVKFKYQAPDSCEARLDTIYVYNSCDILPEGVVSLEQTGMEDVIAEKQISLSCPGVTARITKTIRYNYNQDETDDRGHTTRKTWTYTKSMTVFVQFDQESGEIIQGFDPSTMQMKPKRYKFRPSSYRVSSSSYHASGNEYEAWQNGPILEYEIEASATEGGRCSGLEEDQKDFPLIVDLDVSSGKITGLTIPSFTASLNITGERKCTKKEAGSDPKDVKTTDCSYSLDRTEKMNTEAVSGGDECWEITGGDGRTTVSGGCRSTNIQPLSTQQSEFSWEITIRE